MRSLRAVTLLLTALVATVIAWPAAAQSPLPEPSAGGETGPLLAPAGWILTASQDAAGTPGTVRILATAPTGEQRSVASVDVLAWPPDGQPVVDPRLRALPVTAAGVLPVVLAWTDPDGVAHELLRLHDLLAPDPARPVMTIGADDARRPDLDTVASGPDGRVSIDIQDLAADGSVIATHTLVMDPRTGRTEPLRDLDGPEVTRSDAWLATGDGWPATRDGVLGMLTTAGTFRPTTPPHPLVDLARGARQVSTSGARLATSDVGTDGGRGQSWLPCEVWWTEPTDPGRAPTRTWWDRCRDRGRVLDLRWDVDGAGVLVLVGRAGRMELIRRDRPGRSTLLATIDDPAVERARSGSRNVEVLGLAPGPRPGELLLAFSPVGHQGSVFFLSTLEGTVHELPGTFAGFVEPPIVRTLAD